MMTEVKDLLKQLLQADDKAEIRDIRRHLIDSVSEATVSDKRILETVNVYVDDPTPEAKEALEKLIKELE